MRINADGSVKPGQSDHKEDAFQRIDAELLIPGRGDPIHNATLIYSESKIKFVGPTKSLPASYRCVDVSAAVPVLMPGLWDCHVHYYGTHRYAPEDLFALSSAAAGARIARSLVATLNAGYTSVRELSGYGCDIAPIVNEGWLPGPHIYSAVAILSQTGGHGDARGVPMCDLHAASTGHRQLPIRVCDGVDDCVRAVREMQRRGARVIKIAASGGVSTDGDDIQAQQFSDAEMAAIVSEASRAGLAVAAHAHGKAGIMAALRAGVTTVEHASFLDAEAINLIRDKHAIVVATRGAVVYMAHSPELLTPGQYEKMLALYRVHGISYRMAVQAGLKFALGSDILISSDKLGWVHGANGAEIAYAVEAGLTPLQALEAATANGPETLGRQAPKSGILQEGYDADMISLTKNPLEDVTLFENAANIKDVWKAGKRLKWNGQPIGILPPTC